MTDPMDRQGRDYDAEVAASKHDRPHLREAYSDRTAHFLCHFCVLAYDPFDRKGEEGERASAAISEKLRYFGLNQVKFFTTRRSQQGFSLRSSHDLQAYFAEGDNIAVLVFRGSKGPLDWRTNFNFAKTRVFVGRDQNGKDIEVEVHKGFFDSFSECRAVIEAEINRVRRESPAKPIFIAGHSLGGALAQIATAAFSSDQIAACYTFGSPRVGGRSLDAYVKPPHYRVTNSADIVPFLPLALMGFSHTGDPRLIEDDPPVIYRRKRSAWRQLMLAPWAIICVLFKWKIALAADHHQTVYRERLYQLARSRSGFEVA